MRKLLVASAFWVAVGFVPVSAQSFTSEQLVDACGRANESWISFCNGYVQAAFDSVAGNGVVCPPDGITRAEMAGAAHSLMSSTAQYTATQPGYDVMVAVLITLYPCP